MATEIQVRFIAKATVWIRAFIYDSDDALVDPTTSVKITIVEANTRIKKVDAQNMTKFSTGTYDYYYTLASNAAEGWWSGEIHSTDGTSVSIADFGFEVKIGITS